MTEPYTAVWQLRTGAWAWRVYTPSGETYAAGMVLTEDGANKMARRNYHRMLTAAARQEARMEVQA